MKCLNDLTSFKKLTKNERYDLICAIRSSGSSAHPWPDDTSLPYFTVDYVRKCLTKQMAAINKKIGYIKQLQKKLK
jgi:hypothetical protein